jgi:NAD(P)-dependent dehydrogenase (short-subunit alcohol dehydrogenase family)
MDFRDRHVIVTGGTGALGAAVVTILLASGAVCHVPYYVDEEERNYPHRTHARVKLISAANITSQMVVERIYDGIPKPWASIHLAGGFVAASVAQTEEAELMGMLRTNLVTCFLCCSAAVRRMKRGGGGGRIVNVAARPALEPRLAAGSAAYAASKAGVAVLTQALAIEVLADNILVNAVAPSIMDTPANRLGMPKADYSTWPKVEEVAAVICGLASPENRITSGAIIPVYGRA